MATKIYCTVNGGYHEWWNAIAICEDGHALASHISSSFAWAKHDMGIDNDVMGKHEKYKAHCPEGYELIWVHPDEMRAQVQAQSGVMYDVLLRHQALAPTTGAASSDTEGGGDIADGVTV